ncbi:hypothetical protein B0H11DRAFT_1942808 [Mycena galericulata]|nr:hypothetical protein B0H11DRAFT_1942808 [Mycena galericulata]
MIPTTSNTTAVFIPQHAIHAPSTRLQKGPDSVSTHGSMTIDATRCIGSPFAGEQCFCSPLSTAACNFMVEPPGAEEAYEGAPAAVLEDWVDVKPIVEAVAHHSPQLRILDTSTDTMPKYTSSAAPARPTNNTCACGFSSLESFPVRHIDDGADAGSAVLDPPFVPEPSVLVMYDGGLHRAWARGGREKWRAEGLQQHAREGTGHEGGHQRTTQVCPAWYAACRVAREEDVMAAVDGINAVAVPPLVGHERHSGMQKGPAVQVLI